MTTATETDPIPQSYQAWRHCIEHWCRIELTPEYIEQRIRELQDTREETTRRFIECYGKAHHAAVLGWFQRALQSQ